MGDLSSPRLTHSTVSSINTASWTSTLHFGLSFEITVDFVAQIVPALAAGSSFIQLLYLWDTHLCEGCQGDAPGPPWAPLPRPWHRPFLQGAWFNLHTLKSHGFDKDTRACILHYNITHSSFKKSLKNPTLHLLILPLPWKPLILSSSHSLPFPAHHRAGLIRHVPFSDSFSHSATCI